MRRQNKKIQNKLPQTFKPTMISSGFKKKQHILSIYHGPKSCQIYKADPMR